MIVITVTVHFIKLLQIFYCVKLYIFLFAKVI